MERLTYKKQSTSDFNRFVKPIVMPLVTLLLTVITVSIYVTPSVNSIAPVSVGKVLIAPIVAIMWAFGAAVAWLLPSQRTSTLNETHLTIGGFLIAMLGFKLLYALLLNASTDIPVAGYIQNMMWIGAIGTPIGFIGMMAKKIYTFKRKASNKKFYEQIHSYRDSGRKHQDIS